MYISISAISYVNAVSSDIENSVFVFMLLQIVIQKEDQDLKYKVRDNLIEYMNSLCKDVTSKEEAIKISKLHEEDF